MRRHPFLSAGLFIALVGPLNAQSDKDIVWNSFIGWFKTAPLAGNPLAGYAAQLQKEGKSPAETRQKMDLLTSLMAERSDWIGIYYDKVYARPVTGDPATDRMTTRPSALLAGAIKGMTPGAALDLGIGQGRNAVFLAEQGWAVTGIDVSKQGLAASQDNARKAGVSLTTIDASYEAFDYGSERWDLIVLAFAWAPRDDPAFVARLQKSLRPGGRVIVEHFTQGPGQRGPNITHSLKPSELRSRFEGFEMVLYEEAEGVGDWGGPGSQLVKMVAVKR